MDNNSKGECSEWAAWHDHMPPGPPTLHVKGKCTFPTEGYSVELRPAVPQGKSSKIYILERIVHEPTGPVADVITDVPVHYREQTNTEYDEVHIRPDDVHIKVEEVS